MVKLFDLYYSECAWDSFSKWFIEWFFFSKTIAIIFVLEVAISYVPSKKAKPSLRSFLIGLSLPCLEVFNLLQKVCYQFGGMPEIYASVTYPQQDGKSHKRTNGWGGYFGEHWSTLFTDLLMDNLDYSDCCSAGWFGLYQIITPGWYQWRITNFEFVQHGLGWADAVSAKASQNINPLIAHWMPLALTWIANQITN